MWPGYKNINRGIYSAAAHLSTKFNGLSTRSKKMSVIAFTTLITVLCLKIAIEPSKNSIRGSKDKLTTPDIPAMKEPMQDQKLIPLGKMKGEVDDNYDSFYVAIDNEGKLFINRNLEYGKEAYLKSDRWQSISIPELKEYERHLHFIPMKSKGLKY